MLKQRALYYLAQHLRNVVLSAAWADVVLPIRDDAALWKEAVGAPAGVLPGAVSALETV